MVGVGEADAADVSDIAVDEVKTPKAEPVFNSLELGDAVLIQRGEGVALAAVLRGSRGAHAPRVCETLTGGPTQFVQPGVEHVDSALLRTQLIG